MKNIIIAIDGPAGAGKSTIAKIIAENLNINYIDTGAMYRAITYKCLINNVDIMDEEAVIKIAKDTNLNIMNNQLYIDEKLVDSEIRTPMVNSNVSNIAKIKQVRMIMVDLQRKIGVDNRIILDGRDIGSYVFPNAEYKFYLTASSEERGIRRYKELKEKGHDVNLESVIQDIKTRDEIDSNREFAPLIKAHDAIKIDTSNKTIQSVVKEIMNYIIF